MQGERGALLGQRVRSAESGAAMFWEISKAITRQTLTLRADQKGERGGGAKQGSEGAGRRTGGSIRALGTWEARTGAGEKSGADFAGERALDSRMSGEMRKTGLRAQGGFAEPQNDKGGGGRILGAPFPWTNQASGLRMAPWSALETRRA